uniref:Dynein light chain Tctex-type 1 n=1 Tax=Propithecus coquereli TaxID=379532 RepID=A0A2K6EED4_PROCO
MEDYQAAEETAFVVDEVSNIVKEATESAIGGNAYQHSKVNQWTTNVVEQTLSQLTKLGKPFKYIVTCVIILSYFLTVLRVPERMHSSLGCLMNKKFCILLSPTRKQLPSYCLTLRYC